MIGWKKFVANVQEERRVEAEKKEKEREEMNLAKADWFREKTLAKRHLDRWKGLAKLMARKKQLRELENQKLKSREKVNVFLQNLQEAIKQKNGDQQKSKLVKDQKKISAAKIKTTAMERKATPKSPAKETSFTTSTKSAALARSKTNEKLRSISASRDQ